MLATLRVRSWALARDATTPGGFVLHRPNARPPVADARTVLIETYRRRIERGRRWRPEDHGDPPRTARARWLVWPHRTWAFGARPRQRHRVPHRRGRRSAVSRPAVGSKGGAAAAPRQRCEELGVEGGRRAPLPDRSVQHCVGWLWSARPARPPTLGNLGRQNLHTRSRWPYASAAMQDRHRE